MLHDRLPQHRLPIPRSRHLMRIQPRRELLHLFPPQQPIQEHLLEHPVLAHLPGPLILIQPGQAPRAGGARPREHGTRDRHRERVQPLVLIDGDIVGDGVVGGAGVEEAALGIQDAGLAELEVDVEGDDAVGGGGAGAGDAVQQVLGPVQVRFRRRRVVLLQVEPADPDPERHFLVLADLPL